MTGSDDARKRILLGRIGPAHGIRGEVVVHSFAANPEDVAAYGPLADAPGTRTFALKVVRVTSKGVIARIAGIADRTAAEALRGTELYVDRARLPSTTEDEFYVCDLIGLAAVSPEGASIGTIVAVENYGAGDILEIRLAASQETELVPFSAQFVPEVDIAARRVVVRMPVSSPGNDENQEDSEAG